MHRVSFCKCFRTRSEIVPSHMKACTPFAPEGPIVQIKVWLVLSGISSSNLQFKFRVLYLALRNVLNFYFHVPCLSPWVESCDSATYLNICFNLSFSGNMG